MASFRIVIFALWTGIILYLTLTARPIEATGSEGLYALVKAVMSSVAPTLDAGLIIAKTFHFIAYALWAWLLAGMVAGGYLQPWTIRQMGLCVVLLVAMSTMQEGLQGFVPTRTAAVRDVFINMAGGSLALALRPMLVAYGMTDSATPCPAEETQ